MGRRKQTSLMMQFQDMKNDYAAAKESRYTPRLSGVNPAGSGHSYHIRNEREFLKIIERSRDLFRNDIVIGSAIRRLTANVIQDGFNLDPQTGDESLDQDIKARWTEWSEDADQCHSEGEHTFSEIERLTFQSVITDGDVLHLPLRSGALQAIEAHRLRTPKNTTRDVVHGVMLDRAARRTEYWVTKEDLGVHARLDRVSDMKRYPARDAAGNRAVFHVYLADRFSQRRGITALAPVSNWAGMHDDIQFATMVKQQMSSLIALFREQTGDPNMDLGSTPLGPITNQSNSDGSIQQIEGLAAGLDITGRPGEKLQGFSPNIPSPQYFEHVLMILKFIGINLDLPVAVLLLDPSETNFSGWRGAIDQARIRFRQLQLGIKRQFHQPVYRWKMRQWMAADAAFRNAATRSGINIFGHRWNPPNWAYIEPLKDAQADALQIESLQNSPRRVQAARGRDWNEVARELIEDNRYLVELALEASIGINNQYPEARITWRELLSLAPKDRTNSALINQGDASGLVQN